MLSLLALRLMRPFQNSPEALFFSTSGGEEHIAVGARCLPGVFLLTWRARDNELLNVGLFFSFLLLLHIPPVFPFFVTSLLSFSLVLNG